MTNYKKTRKAGQQWNGDAECRSFTLGDLQNPTDKTLTNTSNHPCFVQGVRPEPCYIAQDFKNSFLSTVPARISQSREQICCISKISLGV